MWSKAVELYFDIVTRKQYEDIEFILVNYDNIRGKGERIKGFGGYSSGYQSVKNMFTKIDRILEDMYEEDKDRTWQKIKPIQALDFATIIAENVVSGGVRRSALIMFCDNDEEEVIQAKSDLYYQDDNGNWVSNDKILHRMLSNNTIFYNERPSWEVLQKQFETMRFSGEPAIANMAEMKRRREDVQGGNPLA